jgi:hypothetical protein
MDKSHCGVARELKKCSIPATSAVLNKRLPATCSFARWSTVGLLHGPSTDDCLSRRYSATILLERYGEHDGGPPSQLSLGRWQRHSSNSK